MKNTYTIIFECLLKHYKDSDLYSLSHHGRLVLEAILALAKD